MVVVLGSGGHTSEMMSLLRDIDVRRYTHRTYIVSSGDDFSAVKANDLEDRFMEKAKKAISSPNISLELPEQNSINKASHDLTAALSGRWEVKNVPRARKIYQPLWSTPFSSIWCLISCLKALLGASRDNATDDELVKFPDVIVTNGPGTAIIVILASYILKFFAVAPLWKMKVIYIESWARVKTLSLSGKILLWTGLFDRFLVQWEELARAVKGKRNGKRVEWRGFLVD